MKLKTIVVDDEAPARRRMKKLLEGSIFCELIGEAERGSQAIDLINTLKPDLVLLDIQLKDMTGFEVLKQLPLIETEVIFITAYDHYAVKAFDENAIDYLLKPYKETRFHDALEKAATRVKNEKSNSIEQLLAKFGNINLEGAKISVQEGKTTHIIDCSKIAYIRAQGYHCKLHFDSDKSKLIRISLKTLESLLPKNFIRINRSVILNAQKILSYRMLKNTLEIELSKGDRFTVGGEKITPLYNYLKSLVY